MSQTPVAPTGPTAATAACAPCAVCTTRAAEPPVASVLAASSNAAEAAAGPPLHGSDGALALRCASRCPHAPSAVTDIRTPPLSAVCPLSRACRSDWDGSGGADVWHSQPLPPPQQRRQQLSSWLCPLSPQGDRNVQPTSAGPLSPYIGWNSASAAALLPPRNAALNGDRRLLTVLPPPPAGVGSGAVSAAAAAAAAAAPAASSCHHHFSDTFGLLPPPYPSGGLPYRGGHQRRRHRRRRSRRRQHQSQQQSQQQPRSSRRRLQASSTGRRWRRSSSSSSSSSPPTSGGGEEPVYSSCCGRQCCRTHLASCLQFRRVLILLASFGIACIVSGVALGALHSPSNSFLTLSLMFVGLGLMLIIVVVIGWRCTPPEHEPCHILFGLGAYCTVTRSRVDRRRRERHYWIGGLLYPEFRFRRPPPSYASAMLDSAAFARRSCPVSSESGVFGGSALFWDWPNAPPPQYKTDVVLHDQPHSVAAVTDVVPAAGTAALQSDENPAVVPSMLPVATASAMTTGSLPPTYRSTCSGPRLALDEVWLEAAALWAAASSRAESSNALLLHHRGSNFPLTSAVDDCPGADTASSSQGSPNCHSTCHVVVDIENAPASLLATDSCDAEPDLSMAADRESDSGSADVPPPVPIAVASLSTSPSFDGRVVAAGIYPSEAVEITPM